MLANVVNFATPRLAWPRGQGRGRTIGYRRFKSIGKKAEDTPMAPSAIASLPAPRIPALPRVVCSRSWALTLWLLVLALLVPGVLPRAWDRDRMLAAAQRQGPEAERGVRLLQSTIVASQSMSEEARLQAFNRLFNEHIVFAEDIDTVGQVDQWASPLELLARGAGDCEDFAIAKYFSLIAAGLPPAKLRMVYVRADLGGHVRAHMVLAYYAQPAAEPLILDNLIAEIRPASLRRDLSPVFSFNAEGLWQGTGAQKAGDPTARLSRWREVLGKARAEGFV
ncbi:transglutaminase-like cysteine peptidase [Methylibium petroleiphilum]|nr:transglutaminase-like cysteine peptidase [Methylibium petroleiphilum]